MFERGWGMMVVIFALPFFLLACGDKEQEAGEREKPGQQSESERLLIDYVRREQLGDFGVYTNRKESSQTGDAASGHEVLSESAGLLLRYYAARPNQHLFEKTWEQTKRVFDGEGGFGYRYSPKDDKRYDVNAAVDDLRIIRALYEGAETFRQSALHKEAKRYGKRLLTYNVREGNLYDFYDAKHKTTNDFLTLCYADLGTLRLLAADDREAAELAERLLPIVQGGYLSDRFPFYETRYRYASGQYETEQIDMVESMLTILSLAEIGEERDGSIEAITRMGGDGELYGAYDKNGTPLTDVRSTALYAIAALIGRAIGDDELYAAAIKRMAEFQSKDTNSVLYGGFGDPVTGQAYSFDNLMALLALAI